MHEEVIIKNLKVKKSFYYDMNKLSLASVSKSIFLNRYIRKVMAATKNTS